MDDRTVDLIFAGSLETLPPVSSKIVRIFTSSTFTDTSLERNTLMAQVYPKLKDYCREKHGLEFQVVDMRWGVRDEATDDHMTTELCMKEIENCQRLSMGPNFVVFLGQKYGYRPIPTYILASELQMIRDTLVAVGTDVTLLDTWYKKDSNAVPPVCILQPISSILVNFNNKRVPKLQQEDQAKWWDTLEKMQKMLRKAALALFTQGSMDHEAMHNYFMSVTEREVINGILNVKNTKNHCLAYVRYINNINLQNLRRAGLFIDIANRAVDSEAVRLLANLRDERLPAKIEPTNLQRYTVDWIGREGLAGDTHEEYLQNFIAHFYRNIARLVDRAMRKEDSSPQGQIVTEILQHLHACNNSVKVFYGRENDLERVRQYIIGPSTEPLVLYGVGGCGKTSLLARSASLIIPWLEGSQQGNTDEDKSRTPVEAQWDAEASASRRSSTHRGSISSESQKSSKKRQESSSGVHSASSTKSKESSNPQSVRKSSLKIVETKKKQQKPVLIARFLGTTPDSSALTPLLISLCQQISYNYMIPFDSIPDDLVPLTAYFKQLLNLASAEQPLLLFLDSVDQLGGAQDANKMAWLPTRLPPNCKIVVSCVYEPDNPDISRDYQILRRMINAESNFIQVLAMGETLALQVIKQWMKISHRDLTNYQWRVVSNAMARCSLPIFVKLVFAEICRWKSYSRPQETHLASNVMDSIMMLFERIEIQHGRILVFHALAYITASKSGLSETELEDLLSLDDRILDDVYQYHLPPVRRIPPLLWTRIRNDLPNYLSEREADGVSVLNWYHRQFKEAAKERYFKNQNMAIYFHSCIAEYFMGTWGGGNPKPFKYTEIQRMRFNLTEKEGEADRKVPLQPLVFYGKDGKVSRYNLRKFGELPYHLVRARRLDDLYNYVLFNYQWLHAKLASCPLQAVLSDFEDACNNLEDREMSREKLRQITREIMLVADALRLGGAILTQYPDMLASQLIGRLLPEAPANPHVRKLLEQCDREGIYHSALIPTAHCLHTPGGPLKYSLEGHQFAVFGFCLTSDARYVVSVSNKFLIWDLSTSDLTRAVAPGIEGVFQGLVLSPDDKFAAAWTNNSQTLILNLLTSETVIVSNPLIPDEGPVKGAVLLDTHCVLYGLKRFTLLNLQGQLLSRHDIPDSDLQILAMDFLSLNDYHIILWSGSLEDKRLEVRTRYSGQELALENLDHAFVLDKQGKVLCASTDSGTQVAIFVFTKGDRNGLQRKGTLQRQVTIYDDDATDPGQGRWYWNKVSSLTSEEPLLQLKFSEDESHLLGTAALGFCIWSIGNIVRGENPKPGKRLDLKLPPGVRNISVKMGHSNSVILSKGDEFAVAGVRKNLYVWGARNGQLLKILDAHFARILAVAPYTTGPWNSVITSSIDRTVKVWNLNNIFEQVHVIDRHELQIDSISLSQKAGIAVTVTRGCVGIWNLKSGKLVDKLAYNALGAIVTHAHVTADGKYIVTSESGSILIWDWSSRKAVFQTEQPAVQQILFMENDARFLAASKLSKATGESSAVIVVRDCPSGTAHYEIEVPIKTFRPVVLTNDNIHIVVMGHERNRDFLFVFQAQTGILIHKFVPKYQGSKDCSGLVAIPGKATQIALLDQDKGLVFDVRTKRHVRTIRRWSGKVTKDGRLGLFAPARGGLELMEMRTSSTVQLLIPRTAEGVFSNVATFNQTDEYVLYYHSGHKTLRMFRVSDGEMLANFRLSAELSALETTADGLCVVAGTVDGCLSVLCIADPRNRRTGEFLAALPSRRPQGLNRNNLSVNPLTSSSSSSSSRPSSSSLSGSRSHMTFKTLATVAAAWAQTSNQLRPGSAVQQRSEASVVSQACVLS